MITLSDLTLLLLGFLVLWYVAGKRPQAAPPPAPQTAEQKPTPVGEAPMRPDLEREDWQAFQDEMQSFIGETGLAKDVTVEFAHDEIVLSLKDTVPFASGRADLRPQALPVLEKLAAMVLSHPGLLLEISGHTDSVPIATAEFPSNWELSSARASRVARYMIERGIHPSRIAVQGYANQRPRMPNSSALSRRRNRRVEIRLYHEAAKSPVP